MKRLIAIVLVTIMLVSCTSNVKINGVELAEKYGYISVKNISYGMSYDECVKAFDDPNAEFKPVDASYLIEQGLIKNIDEASIYDVNTTLFDQPVKMILQFRNKLFSDEKNVGLNQIHVVFENEIPKDEFIHKFEDFLANNINSNYEDGTPTGIDNLTIYYNEKTLQDIEDEVIQENAIEMADSGYIGEIDPDDGLSASKKYSGLDKININSNEDGNVINITFNNETAIFLAYVTNNPK